MEHLPEALADGPFSTRAARELGVRSRVLRGSGLVSVTHGARAHRQPESLDERAKAFRVALHGEVAFSHVTAAQLWGLPLPRHLEAQQDLDVMCGDKAGPVKRAGCIGHRGLGRRTVLVHRGVPLTSPADTWVDLGEVLSRGLTCDDVVVAGDVVARRLGGPEGGDRGAQLLAEVLHARVRPRGKLVLAEALTLVSPRSKSPMETRARLVFARGGLPSPEINVAVHFDSDDGADGSAGWMLEGDFVWREQRVIGEYQGDHHKSIRQRAVDVAKRHLAEDEGWCFVEVFAGDVFHRAKRFALLRRLGRALGVAESELVLA